MVVNYDLIKYEDPQEGSVPVYFWIDDEGMRISPYMNNETECKYWMYIFKETLKKYIETKGLT